MRRSVILVRASVVATCGVAALGAQQSAARPAIPVEPIQAVVDAFGSHQLVAVADPHGNQQAHAFRQSLIRDPRFGAVVDDIVVEFGSARYQERMDRFIRGEVVADDRLREIWQNTTVPNIGWDRPIYEELFRTIRAVNASRPQARQLRVLLGDPPIDWDNVHSTDALMTWMNDRDTYPAGVVQREVLAKNRRALIIYGGGHFFRFDSRTLVSLIEGSKTTKVFTVWVDPDTDLAGLESRAAAWPVPSLSILRGTTLGATPVTAFIPIPAFGARPMEDEFDAVLYLGPRSTMTTAALSPARCADAAYMEMRLGRMALLPGPPGAPNPVDQLKTYCARVQTK